MSNEKQQLGAIKEGLINGFNYDIKAIENRIANSAALIARTASGVIDPANKDFTTAHQSLMNARAKAPIAGKPVESVVSFAEVAAEIERKLEKNSPLFSLEEKDKILKTLKEKRQALDTKFQTVAGIQSLVLDDFKTETIRSLNLTNDPTNRTSITPETKALLETSIANLKVTQKVDGTDIEEAWALPLEILPLLTQGNNNLAKNALRDILQKHLLIDNQEVTLDLDKVSQDIKHLITTGINIDPNRIPTTSEKQTFGSQIVKNASLKNTFANDSESAQIARNVLSECNISTPLMGDKEFRRDLAGEISQTLPKYQKNTPKVLESAIQNCVVSALGKKMIREIMTQESEKKQTEAIKKFTDLTTQAKISIETLADPEFKKLITNEKGQIDFKKLDVKTLQSMALEVNAKHQVALSQTVATTTRAPQNVIHFNDSPVEESSTDPDTMPPSPQPTTIFKRVQGVTTTDTSTDDPAKKSLSHAFQATLGGIVTSLKGFVTKPTGGGRVPSAPQRQKERKGQYTAF